MCIIISKKPHVYVSVVKILIRNNDYFHFMISTKTRVINLKTGSIIVDVNPGQAVNHRHPLALMVRRHNFIFWHFLSSVNSAFEYFQQMYCNRFLKHFKHYCSDWQKKRQCLQETRQGGTTQVQCTGEIRKVVLIDLDKERCNKSTRVVFVADEWLSTTAFSPRSTINIMIIQL